MQTPVKFCVTYPVALNYKTSFDNFGKRVQKRAMNILVALTKCHRWARITFYQSAAQHSATMFSTANMAAQNAQFKFLIF